VDFTKATDEEIIAFVSRTTQPVCGQFRGNQLKTYTLSPPVAIRPGYTLLKAGAMSLLLLVMNKQAAAQTTSPKLTTEIVQQTKHADKPTATHKTVVRGVVISEDDKLPVAAANILQKGTANGVIADADGRYALTINPAEGSVLTVSFIGMTTREITLPDAEVLTLNIGLASDVTTLGEVIWAGEAGVETAYAEKNTWLVKFRKKLRRLFY
jgi:hypothetical protein